MHCNQIFGFSRLLYSVSVYHALDERQSRNLGIKSNSSNCIPSYVITAHTVEEAESTGSVVCNIGFNCLPFCVTNHCKIIERCALYSFFSLVALITPCLVKILRFG